LLNANDIQFWILDCRFSIGGKGMNKKRTWIRWLDFFSDNWKSKTCTELSRSIQNRKWVGFIAIFLSLLGIVGMAEAQQPTRVPRIGFLSAPSPSAVSARAEAFRQGLRDLGHVEGKDIAIEYRYAEGKLDRFPALAAELVRLKVDVIVTGTSAGTRSAKEATATIPIVMAQDGDPVGNGFVASLARPGGNITGLSSLAPEISGKRLELLKEIGPKFSRVAVFGNSAIPGTAQSLKESELAAGVFGVHLQYLDVRNPKDIETAFSAASKGRADAVLVLASPVFNVQRKQIVDLAVKSRLPVIYYAPEWVQDGGLMSYGVNYTDLYRRAATYVDRILKGTKPADLPVEQPKKFEFIINLNAAKQIGLTIPPNVLARADKVIR
jgi:putative tryptophan/tyrosine transport system substrate-binding protein